MKNKLFEQILSHVPDEKKVAFGRQIEITKI